MACKWRIRHKLIIGFALVLGVIALILTGTVRGLTWDQASFGKIDSKWGELDKAHRLHGKLLALASKASNSGPLLEPFREEARDACKALDDYELTLNHTIERKRDAQNGRDERETIGDLRTQLRKLDAVLNTPAAGWIDGSDQPLVQQRDRIIQDLVHTSADLLDRINTKLGDLTGKEAKRHYQYSMGLVITTSIGGIILLTCLLRAFYRWVFFPVRALQQGAHRVAKGDFDHRIVVHSGDELEDLATGFNEMTERLQMIYSDLARQVNERSRQLVRSERLASVGFLAAGVAHEINNPLASIAFCSEALEARLTQLFGARGGLRVVRGEETDEVRKEDLDVVTRYLRMIQEEAFRCKEITGRLLEFSRGGEKRREPVELSGLIKSVLDVVQHLQNRTGKEIVFEPAVPVTAWVNGQEIKSVVLNLIVNALDSMEDGGRLTIHLGQRDRMAVLEFTDTGCGMTSEVLENIFEPFFTRSRTGKGTGLGLTICHRVITQHGGEIEATSAGANQGSTFTVRLPLEAVSVVEEEPLGQAA